MDELGKSIPLAEGIVDAEQSGSRTPNTHCLNCGTQLIDMYCHHCGQKDIPKRQTLGELLTNFISSFWSYEGKFFRTIRYLITKPGMLALEYNAGKRESYYHPARMYVFMSFVFFLVIFSLPDDEEDNILEVSRKDLHELKDDYAQVNIDSLFQNAPAQPGDSAVRLLSKPVLDSLRRISSKGNGSVKSLGVQGNGASINLDTDDYQSLHEYDSTQQALPADKRDGWLTQKLVRRGLQLNSQYAKNQEGFGDAFADAFLNNFSKVLFWLMPVFALLLKLLYIRRDFYYSEHLVFTIYYYNFFYFTGTLVALAALLPGSSIISIGLGLWIYVYLLFAMKRVYKQNWRKITLKFLLFSFVFVVCLAIGLTLNAVAIFLTL